MTKKKEKVEKEDEEKLYDVLPVTRQLVLRYLAQSSEGYFPDKVYYLIQAIEHMKQDIPEIDAELRKEFSLVYPKLYNQFEKDAIDVKKYYDLLRGEKITVPDITSQIFIEYEKTMAKLQLVNRAVYKIFYFAFKKTKLVKMSIPSTAFADARMKYKTFEPKDEQKFRERHEDDVGIEEYDEDDIDGEE